MDSKADELKYWRKLWRKARSFKVNLHEKLWCSYWHTHFDWDGRGNRSRFEHRAHIRVLMLAFNRAQQELKKQEVPYQVYVCICSSASDGDALYVHTPNPHTKFPTAFDNYKYISTLPPLLSGLIDMNKYEVNVMEVDGCKYYNVIPKGWLLLCKGQTA